MCLTNWRIWLWSWRTALMSIWEFGEEREKIERPLDSPINRMLPSINHPEMLGRWIAKDVTGSGIAGKVNQRPTIGGRINKIPCKNSASNGSNALFTIVSIIDGIFYPVSVRAARLSKCKKPSDRGTKSYITRSDSSRGYPEKIENLSHFS